MCIRDRYTGLTDKEGAHLTQLLQLGLSLLLLNIPLSLFLRFHFLNLKVISKSSAVTADILGGGKSATALKRDKKRPTQTCVG